MNFRSSSLAIGTRGMILKKQERSDQIEANWEEEYDLFENEMKFVWFDFANRLGKGHERSN